MTPERLRRVAARRRVLFFGLTFMTSLFLTGLMWDILRANGFTGLEKAGLVLFFILITWITGAFWTALIGFVILLRGRDKAVIHSDEVAGHTLVGPHSRRHAHLQRRHAAGVCRPRRHLVVAQGRAAAGDV